MVYPTWLSAVLFVAGAVLAWLGSQTSVRFEGMTALIIGALEVAVMAALAFQRATTNVVRSLTRRS